MYHIYLRHGTSVFWHLKTRLASGLVTADLTTIVAQNYKSLINYVKPVQSLIHSIWTLTYYVNVLPSEYFLHAQTDCTPLQNNETKY